MANAIQKPLILGIVADLFFISKIEPIIERTGCSARWFDRIEDLIEGEDKDEHQSTIRLSARQKEALVDKITTLLPVLIIIDINLPGSSWQAYLPLLKSDPATRRIPVLVYGPHVQAKELSLAQDLGADISLPRSKFLIQLSQIIEQQALIPDNNIMLDACRASLSAKAITGIEQFNQEEYFQAHEYLEQAWIEDDSEGRDLYRALVQAAVVCYQIERGNYMGARKMFLRLRQWLAWLPDECRGIDIEKLRMDIDRTQMAFLAIGPESLIDFDRNAFPKITYYPKLI